HPAGGRVGGVDDDADRGGGRAVAGRVGDDGAELVAAIGEAGLGGRGARPRRAAVARNLIGHADAIGVAGAAQAEVEAAVLGDRDRVAAAGVGQVGEGERAGDRRGVVDDDADRIAGGAVAGRVGDDGAELVAAVGEAGLGGRGARPAGAAVARNLIGHGDAVGVVGAAQAEVEAAVLGDRDRLAAAGVGQVGEGERAGDRRGVVDDDADRIAGGAVAGRVGDDGAELIAAIGEAGLGGRGARPAGAAVARNLIGQGDAVGVVGAAQAEVEAAVLGDRDRLAAAGVGQV